MSIIKKAHVIMIGQTSPPFTGEALSFLLLSEHLKNQNRFMVSVIDKDKFKNGHFRKIVNALRVLSVVIGFIITKPISGLYLTCGQKRGGIFRDSIVIIFCYLFKIPSIIHLHGGGIKDSYNTGRYWLKKLMRYVYCKPKCIIVLGSALFDQFYFINEKHHIHIIKNSYYNDTPNIELTDKNYYKLKSHDHMKLLYLSNVLPTKGFFDVLDALLILKEKKIPFEFNFAGSIIPEGLMTKEKIQNRIGEYKQKLGNRFIVHGFLIDRKKWEILAQSNIFLLPTYFSAEGQPISIIEALYFGNCIITTRYRGIPDLVQEAINGWFVNFHDPEGIADRLEWLWKNPYLMKKICIENYKNSKDMYAPDRFLSDMDDILGKVFELNNGDT